MSYELIFERTTDLSPAQIWRAWTTPDILMQWFCPAPWRVSQCEIDLKVGGGFYGLVQSKDGLVHKVQPGNYLGQNYGRVTRISETEIVLREIVQDAAGEWTERPATLQLVEGTSK